MATFTKKISGRLHAITSADDGQILELGPATTGGGGNQEGTFAIQFKPELDWDGQIVVAGRVFGKAADDVDLPFIPIPYRRANLDNLASDYRIVFDPINSTALIQVPASGLSVGLLVTCTAGKCFVVSQPLNGSSAV